MKVNDKKRKAAAETEENKHPSSHLHDELSRAEKDLQHDGSVSLGDQDTPRGHADDEGDASNHDESTDGTQASAVTSEDVTMEMRDQ